MHRLCLSNVAVHGIGQLLNSGSRCPPIDCNAALVVLISICTLESVCMDVVQLQAKYIATT